LNGRRVQGSIDLETLVDLAEEEQERLAAWNMVFQHDQPPSDKAFRDKRESER